MNDKGPLIKAALEKDSMLDEPQLDYLIDLAETAPMGAACEVGVYRGGTTYLLATVRKGSGTFYVVDDWRLNRNGIFSREEFARNVPGPEFPELVTVDTNSREAADQIREPLAFCFIDGFHGIGGITEDVQLYPPKIALGGIIAFHDYYDFRPHKATVVVKCVVDAWFAGVEGWERLAVVGSVAAFRRVL